MDAPFYYQAPPTENREDISEIPLTQQTLFESRARLRKMRVLIDERTIPQAEEKSPRQPLNFFLQSDLLDVWYINPPFPHVNDGPDIEKDFPTGRISVVETTGTLGPFAGGGTTYGYSYKEIHDNEESSIGGVARTGTAQETLLAVEIGAGITSHSSDILDQIKTSTALKEIAKKINADIVISDEYVDNEVINLVLGNGNFISSHQAVSTLAHYLRTQGYFLAGWSPHRELDPDDYYLYAVYAYAPHIRHWTGKIDRAVEFFGDEHSIHAFYADTAISRCSRALRRYDDLLLYLGRPLSRTSIDDAIDTVDHILISLCAAIDALARSISKALDSKERGLPKLHRKDWVKKVLHPVYGTVPEYKKLRELLPEIDFIFKVRNSIHSLGLMPYAETHPTRSKEWMRIQIVIPLTSKDSWEKMPEPTRQAWGLKISQSGAHVDLLTFARTCLEKAFSFIDVFCEIISFEQVESKEQVLYENMIKIQDEIGLEMSTFIASTGFFTSPLLTGAYDPDGKRKLPVDEESAQTQKMERILRDIGWKPRPDFTPLRQPPTITTHFRHPRWPQ